MEQESKKLTKTPSGRWSLVWFSKEDGEFVAMIPDDPDLKYVSGMGSTEQEALEMLDDVMILVEAVNKDRFGKEQNNE